MLVPFFRQHASPASKSVTRLALDQQFHAPRPGGQQRFSGERAHQQDFLH